jgi:D-alanine-D-alanine ligase
MNRTRILLLFGGESSEHNVSISSASNVYAAMDDETYDVTLCYIDREGKWWLLDSIDDYSDTQDLQQLMPVLGSSHLMTIPDQLVIEPDVILPILHGVNGEDGSVQGLAQLLHIPIIGCDIASSGIGLHKVLTKQLLGAQHIPVVPYEVHRVFEPVPEFHKLTMTLGSPLFVKPARGGSSVGVSKVYNEDELAVALDLAHKHDDTVLLEQAIAGRELEVAVVGTVPNHRVSTVGEVISDADFYTYDDKYNDGTSSVAIPADVSSQTMSRIQALAGRVYEVLGCKGLSRVDFFLTQDEKLYLNEVNTFPGFTNISMYPKLWKYEGVSYAELIELLISDALARGTISQKEMEE